MNDQHLKTPGIESAKQLEDTKQQLARNHFN